MIGIHGVSRLLDRSVLAGREVIQLPVGGTADVVLAIEIAPGEVESAWRAARVLVDETERWPLAAGDHGVGIDHLLGYGERHWTPAEICEGASRLTIADVLAFDIKNYAVTRRADWSHLVDFHLAMTRRWSGAAPSTTDALREVKAGDELGLERWLLDYEERHEPPHRPDRSGYMSWWQPRERCFLTLLPTARSGASLAYVPWFGFEQTSCEHVVRALQSWDERFGAELVGCWGTMLDFVVTNPPRTVDEAFMLAAEHAAIAPATMGLAGLTIRDHARELVGRTTWQLHERP